MSATQYPRRTVLFGFVALAGLLALACLDNEDLTGPDSAGEPPGSGPTLDIAVECEANVKDGTIECGALTKSRGELAPQLDIVGGQGKYINLVSSAVSYAADTLRADVTVQNLMDAPVGTPDGTTLTGVDVFFLLEPRGSPNGSGEVTVCNADDQAPFTGSQQPLFHYDEILATGETSAAKTWKFCLPPTVEVFVFWVAVHADMPPRLWYVREPEDVHPEWAVFARDRKICPLTVEARDPNGAVITTHSSEICLQIGTNPGGGTLSGQVCEMPVDGRATFDSVSIDANGDEYTLVATSSGLVQRESFPFSVATPGDFNGDDSVDQRDLDALLENWGVGSCLLWDINKDGAVDVLDLGTLLSNWTGSGVATDSVSGVTTTSATLHGSVDTTGLSTEAWFEWGTDQTLATRDSTPRQDADSGQDNVHVSAPLSALTAGTTYYFRMVAETNGTRREGNIRSFHPPVAELSFKTPPSATPAGYRICPAIEVQAQADAPTPVTSFEGRVVLRLGSNSSGGFLSNGGPVNAAHGIATFDAVRVSQPGEYTVIADGASRTAESQSFKIAIPGDLNLDDRVDWVDLDTLQAHWTETGDCLPYDINRDGTVDVVDLGILLSHWTFAAGDLNLDGWIDWCDLQNILDHWGPTPDRPPADINKDGHVDVMDLGIVLSGWRPEPGSGFVFSVQPNSTVGGQTILPPVEVTLQDGSGNPKTCFTGEVTIELGDLPSPATLSGTRTVKAVEGGATFSDLRIDEPGQGYTLVAYWWEGEVARSAPFDILPPPQLVLSPSSFNLGTFTEGASPPDTFFTIANAGAGTLDWTVMEAGSVAWMTQDPTSGTTSTEIDTVRISFNTAGLPPGEYGMLIAVIDEVVDDTAGVSLGFSVAPAEIAFASSRSGNWDIWVGAASDVAYPRQITSDPSSDRHPTWSPDGTQLAFTRSNVQTAGDIWISSVLDLTATAITADLNEDTEPAWSPDGTQIAFMRRPVSNSEIYVMLAEGSDSPGVNITNNFFGDREPAWSPDGSKVAFASLRSGYWDIWVMNADGTGDPINLTNRTDPDHWPTWSPDGTRIAFFSISLGNMDIWVVNSDGSGALQRLTTDTSADDQPAWSPDGARIAYTSNRSGDYDIWVMSADGSDAPGTNITNHPAADRDPAWLPREGQ